MLYLWLYTIFLTVCSYWKVKNMEQQVFFFNSYNFS